MSNANFSIYNQHKDNGLIKQSIVRNPTITTTPAAPIPARSSQPIHSQYTLQQYHQPNVQPSNMHTAPQFPGRMNYPHSSTQPTAPLTQRLPTLTVQHFNPTAKQQDGKPVPSLPCNLVDPYSLPQQWGYLELKSGFTFERTDENIAIYPDDPNSNVDGKGFTFTIQPSQVVFVPDSTQMNYKGLKIQIWLCEVTIERRLNEIGWVHTVEDAMGLCCVAEKLVPPSGVVTFSDPIRFRYENRCQSSLALKQYLRFVLIHNNIIISFVDSCLFAVVRQPSKHDPNHVSEPLRMIQPQIQPHPQQPPAFQYPQNHVQTRPLQPIAPAPYIPPIHLRPIIPPITQLHVPTTMNNHLNYQPGSHDSPTQKQPQYKIEVKLIHTLIKIFANATNNRETMEKIYDILLKIRLYRSDLQIGITNVKTNDINAITKKRKLQEMLEDCNETIERDAKRIKKTNQDIILNESSSKSDSVLSYYNVVAPSLDLHIPHIFGVTHHHDSFDMSSIAIIHIRNLDALRIQDIRVKFGRSVVNEKDLLDIRPSGIKCRVPIKHSLDPDCVRVSVRVQYAQKSIKFDLNDAYNYENYIASEPTWEESADEEPPSINSETYRDDDMTFVSAKIGYSKHPLEDMTYITKLPIYSNLQPYETEIVLLLNNRDSSTQKYSPVTKKFKWALTPVEQPNKHYEFWLINPSDVEPSIWYRNIEDEAHIEYNHQNGTCEVVIIRLPIVFNATRLHETSVKWWVLNLVEVGSKNIWFTSRPFMFNLNKLRKLPSGTKTVLANDKEIVYIPRNAFGQTKYIQCITGQTDIEIQNIEPYLLVVDCFGRTPLHLAFALGDLANSQRIIKTTYQRIVNDSYRALVDVCYLFLRFDIFNNTVFHLAMMNDQFTFLKSICEWSLKTLDWNSSPSVILITDDIDQRPSGSNGSPSSTSVTKKDAATPPSRHAVLRSTPNSLIHKNTDKPLNSRPSIPPLTSSPKNITNSSPVKQVKENEDAVKGTTNTATSSSIITTSAEKSYDIDEEAEPEQPPDF